MDARKVKDWLALLDGDAAHPGRWGPYRYANLYREIAEHFDRSGQPAAARLFRNGPGWDEILGGEAARRLIRADVRDALSAAVTPSPKAADAWPPFVMNDHQQRIFAALAGRALKVKELGDIVLGGDYRRLYKVGLLELKNRGLVAHKHGVGYYRPDSPPAPLAVATN